MLPLQKKCEKFLDNYADLQESIQKADKEELSESSEDDLVNETFDERNITNKSKSDIDEEAENVQQQQNKIRILKKYKTKKLVSLIYLLKFIVLSFLSIFFSIIILTVLITRQSQIKLLWPNFYLNTQLPAVLSDYLAM